MTSVWFNKKKLHFSVQFQLYKINCGFVFWFGFFALSVDAISWFTLLQYVARNDILPCWIGPTSYQLKWLRTRNADTWHEEKYFRRRTANETTWKTVPKPLNMTLVSRISDGIGHPKRFPLKEHWICKLTRKNVL